MRTNHILNRDVGIQMLLASRMYFKKKEKLTFCNDEKSIPKNAKC